MKIKKSEDVLEVLRNMDRNRNICTICLEKVSIKAAPKSIKGRQMYCGHTFHENCIREWLKHGQNCPECRRIVLLGRDVPILVDEDTNQPSNSSIELHKRLMFLQELSTGNEHRELVDFLMYRTQQRHKMEITSWSVTISEAWNIDANLIKPILVRNAISNAEFEEYSSYYSQNLNEFFSMCLSTGFDDTLN